jgi:hypothetical protein
MGPFYASTSTRRRRRRRSSGGGPFKFWLFLVAFGGVVLVESAKSGIECGFVGIAGGIFILAVAGLWAMHWLREPVTK